MLEFYRTTSMLRIDTWVNEEKDIRLCMLQIAPALEGNPKGQPKPGEKRFNYDNAINISFNEQQCLIGAFSLLELAYGGDSKYEKFADLSKVENATANDKKKLCVQKNEKNGGISFYLSQGETKKCNITLSNAEVYAIAKWLEAQGLRFCDMLNRKKEAQSKK